MIYNRRSALKFLIIFLFFTVFLNFLYSDNIPTELINFGLDFLENPSDIFVNIQHNAEDVSPNLEDKTVNLRINLFPALFPTTIENFSLKIKFNKSFSYFPQIDLCGGFGKILALDFLTQDMEEKPQSNAYYYALTFSGKMDEKTRLYLGVKFSEFLLKFKLQQGISEGAFSLKELNFTVNDTFLFSGIELKTKKNLSGEKKNVIIAQTSYGIKNKKIAARIGWFSEHIELGIDVFPEGLLVFQPFWAYHWRF